MTPALSPSESDLKAAVISLKSSHSTLGITKIHALLLDAHPEWIVSEKRTRKALQSEGLTAQPEPQTAKDTDTDNNSSSKSHPKVKSRSSGSNIFPSSKIIPNLDVSKYTAKVEVRHFNKKKGKGLVATEKILAGEHVWKEDPYVVAAEWEIYDMQISGQACSFCTTPFSSTTTTSLLTSCSASSSASHCPARFCNRLCLARSARTHPLLCPAQNPASVPLLKYVRNAQWMALHALICTTSRVMILAQNSKAEAADEEWKIVTSFATLSMEDRAKKARFNNATEPNEPEWRNAFKLYMQAFKSPSSPPDSKKLSRIIKKPLKGDIDQGLFQYDAFLRNLGKMNLNLEGHGGLYVLHSHLNHSCDPNISVRHLDQRTALSRITVVAKKDIEPGEELLITYVNPMLGVKARRDELEAWGFGRCACVRCVREEKESGEGQEASSPHDAVDMNDLEKELKVGLGVL